MNEETRINHNNQPIRIIKTEGSGTNFTTNATGEIILLKKEKTQTEVQRAYEFVAKIIDSCLDTFHLHCAELLLRHFKTIYYEQHGGKIAYDNLLNAIVNKIPSLIELT